LDGKLKQTEKELRAEILKYKISIAKLHKHLDAVELELPELKALAKKVKLLHGQEVTKMEGKLKQTEMELRAELLKCNTEKTKLDKHLDKKEEMIDELTALAIEVEKLQKKDMNSLSSKLA